MDLSFLRQHPYRVGRGTPLMSAPDLGVLLVGASIRQTCSKTARTQIELNLSHREDHRVALFAGERPISRSPGGFAVQPLAATPRALVRAGVIHGCDE